MGLFQKAAETYDAMEHLAGVCTEGKETLAPVGHIIASPKIEITIDADGNFVRARVVDLKIPIPCTEQSSGRTSGAIAHPLCDNIGYISGIYEGKYKLYIEELSKWDSSEYTSPKIHAVFLYVQKGTVLSDLENANILKWEIDEKKNTRTLKNEKDLITWRVEGLGEDSGAVYEDIALMKKYSRYYLSYVEQNPGICMITGKNGQTASQHLKGVSSFSGNAKLISANDTSNYTYRGRFLNDAEALSIGYLSSQKAHNALKWLLANQGIQIGERRLICWNPSGIEIPKVSSPLSEFFKGSNLDSKADPTNYVKQLRNVVWGYKSKLPESESVIIASFEAATSGRLSVTYYNELNGSDFLDRLYYWDTTCCWNSYVWGNSAPSLYQIVNCAFGTQRGSEENARIETDSRVIGQQIQRLVFCRLNKALFPTDIMRALTQKASNLQIYSLNNREKMLVTACAAIRKYRFDHNKEEWNMALEENRKDRSYQYGRLLAIMEKIERDTYDQEESRETNAIRSQAIFVQKPELVFSQIMTQLKTGYYPRLSVGARSFYDRLIGEIQEILSELDEKEYGRPLTETYLMGYYLQKNKLYSKKTKNQEEE